MAQPTINDIGYVYCWTDTNANMLYVGVKKGEFNSEYISSSATFNAEYQSRPDDFSREVIANCTWKEALNLEEKILTSANATLSEDYYNRSNGNKSFVCTGHTDDTRKKMSETWKNKGTYNCDHDRAISSWTGSKHSDESKRKMSESRDKYRKLYSDRMKRDNPMKNPETIAKMLDTRRRNKELRDGTTDR